MKDDALRTVLAIAVIALAIGVAACSSTAGGTHTVYVGVSHPFGFGPGWGGGWYGGYVPGRPIGPPPPTTRPPVAVPY